MISLGSIILIRDDAGLLPRVTNALVDIGYDIVFVDSKEAAKEYLRRGSFAATVRVSEFTFNADGSFSI